MGFTLGTKFNEGTDWEFTVSAETIAEAVQAEGGITEADIADYCYVGLIDARVVAMLAESTRNSNDGLYPWAMEYCAAYNTNNGAHPSKVQMNVNQKEQNAVTCYQRNIICYYGTIGGKTGHFLVMDMADIKKWIMDYDVYPAYQAGTATTTTGFPGYTGPCYIYNEANVARVTPYEAEGSPTADLFLMNVFADENTLWIGALNPTAHSKEKISNEKLSHAAYEFDFAAADIYNAYYTGYIYQAGPTPLQGWSNFPDAEFPDPPGNTTVFTSCLECDDSCDSLIVVSGQYGNNSNPYITNCEQGNIVKTLHGVHTVESWGGLLFKDNNVIYKPIIEGGLVTGFTSDMDIPSEWDDMMNVTGNHISPTPPGPPPSGDDEDNKDPVNTTGAPFSAGLCHYYALTAGSVLLDHISEALGTWDIENTHKDLYKNLVSCKLIKPPAPIPTTGSAPFTIYGVKPQYQGADITLPVVTGNPEATFGPYTIDRKFGDFRDYAPYTRVSIFLPCCGWCDLPSHVVGRQVTVKYFTDIIAATCKAVVFCNNNIIAEAAGVIGLDIPFVADNVGAKMQAVTAGMIAALGGGIQLGAGIGTMVSTKSGNGAKAALSGASQYLSGYSQMAMAFNENTTEISGKNGDGCCLAGATNIIIKIVRPKKGAYTVSPFTPPGYGHNVGFVSQKQVKVSSVSGLLIADNVDTSGISGATEAERAEIKRVLETGLIVNAAPE